MIRSGYVETSHWPDLRSLDCSGNRDRSVRMRDASACGPMDNDGWNAATAQLEVAPAK